MKLDLNEIAAHLRKRVECDVAEPPLVEPESGVVCVEPIVGRLVFQNTGTLIHIRGEVSTGVELQCSRCLKPCLMKVDISVEENLPIRDNAFWDDNFEPDDDDLPEDSKVPIFENNIFDLTEMLRQLLAVNIPIRTVCSADCKGICVSCGKDLNAEQCECKSAMTNSPFAALGSLLADRDDASSDEEQD